MSFDGVKSFVWFSIFIDNLLGNVIVNLFFIELFFCLIGNDINMM